MEFENGVLHFTPFFAVTLGIVVLFLGKRVNDAVGFLREFSIPEPVTGGLIMSLLIALVYVTSGVEIEFDLAARDVLLVYFFTTIGINSSLKDLLSGGKPLVILLAITIGYMFLQNLTGITVASLFDLPTPVGLLGGTVSLIGGHGTAIAWSPRIAEDYGISNAMEIGLACATFGLILASLMGGPIAKLLIMRYKLKPAHTEQLDIGTPDTEKHSTIGHLDLLDAILAIHVSAIVGFLLNEELEALGLKLPLFVTCLFAGILITNLIPKSFPRISGTKWPTRTPAIALIADVSLGTFLAMSLMIHHPRRPVPDRDQRDPVRGIPCYGARLRCRCHLLGVRGYFPGLHTNSHGQHVSGCPALWRFAPGVHYRTAGVCFFHRPGQRAAYPLLPD